MMGRFGKLSDCKEWHLLLLLFLFALIVRVIGINYGYWFGDERINDAAKVLAGQVIPSQHFYPPFLNYLTAVFFAGLYVVGRLFVSWYDLAEFRAQYFSDPTPFYVTARFLVALISSALAPLFYLIARECQLSKRYALIAGLFGALIPGVVLLSHIAKGDVPLGVCAVLVFYMTIKKLKSPNSLLIDVFTGVAIALAFSFKQSYIFILIPFYTFFLLTLYLQERSFLLIVRSAFVAVAVTIPLWGVLNIGILLDFQNFLDYQKIQSVMSVREEKELFVGLMRGWGILSDTFFGLNWIMMLVFVLSPILLLSPWCKIDLSLKRLFLSFWLSLVLAALLLMYLSGGRQQSGLWAPYMGAIQLLAIIPLLILAKFLTLPKRIPVYVVSLFAGLISIYGVAVINYQAIAKPIVLSVEELLRSKYQPLETKFLTAFTLRSPQTVTMNKAEYARHERIAARYSVIMPERAPEKVNIVQASNAINYFNMPSALHGLETSDDDTLGENMKPYAWPIQEEEWQLDYWLEQGFRVFILGDHDNLRLNSNVPVIRAFNQEVKDRCELVEYFEPTKPLYIEFSATVYECNS